MKSSKLSILSGVVGAVLLTLTTSFSASGGEPGIFTHNWARSAASTYPWHGGYYHQQYNAPLALVVPPTSHMRQTYSWGVSQNLMYPLHHQFGRNYPGSGFVGEARFQPTPPWPSHTDQFGVYYVRGPW